MLRPRAGGEAGDEPFTEAESRRESNGAVDLTGTWCAGARTTGEAEPSLARRLGQLILQEACFFERYRAVTSSGGVEEIAEPT